MDECQSTFILKRYKKLLNMETYHTLYEWCLLNNISPNDTSDEDIFMLDEISLEVFKQYLKDGDYNIQSLPTKPEKYLELRMYGLVPYNLSAMQQGIQYDHAKDVYNIEYGTDERYNTFLREWKTTIILNGGTSNEGHIVRQGFKHQLYVGSMQQHLADLKANDIRVSTFYEPDLNSMLTAIVFLVDERVFNKKLYPDYQPLPFTGESDKELAEWSIENIYRRNKWVSKIGGPKNEFLRDFLLDKKLA